SFFWVYCSDSEYDLDSDRPSPLVKPGRCPVGGSYSGDYWGAPYCLSNYCEECYMQDFVKSRANSYSNVAFLAVGTVILAFAVEDYLFFNVRSPDSPSKPKMMDYCAAAPPNLMLGGAGKLNLLFAVAGATAMLWAGVGAFVYHASMTPRSAVWDICSVYTLVWFGIPYQLLNSFHFIKWKAPRVFITIVIAGVIFTFRIYDLWLMVVATAFMLFAYVARERDEAWCIHHDSPIQGHAIWHTCMALGVMFFYLFLRQERPWGEGGRNGSLAESQWMERDVGADTRRSDKSVLGFFRSSSSSSAASTPRDQLDVRGGNAIL
ncbi:hypothetical protein TrRE_jg7341, partial [Triparma retinervis]